MKAWNQIKRKTGITLIWNDYNSMLIGHGKLTSISPLMTHGNELRGEIKLLNKARQVKTYNKDSKRDQ